MKRNMKRIISVLMAIVAIVVCMGNYTYAHSGRTDANGGHRDNNNKSGLGSYHYHCGGHPAHLHTNGVCPYSSSSSLSNSSTSSSTESSTKTRSTVPTTIVDSNPLGGIMALGVLGGGGYWGYKKLKK